MGFRDKKLAAINPLINAYWTREKSDEQAAYKDNWELLSLREVRQLEHVDNET